MQLPPDALKKLLVEPGHITEEDFGKAQAQAQEEGRDILEVLIDQDYIEDYQFGQLLADALHYPFVNLRQTKIAEETLKMIPEIMARAKGVIAFSQSPEGLKVGMINPEDKQLIHTLEKRAGQKVIPYMITPLDLQVALGHYKRSLTEEFEKILKLSENQVLTREERDNLTIKTVDLLFQYGFENRASDIHIEPLRRKIIIRFRIDGMMHRVLEVPRELYELIVMRIKILAKMRTDEHRAAQDGKLRFEAEEEIVDVRVSVVPVTEGENVVMRLLSSKSRQYGLTDLGFSEADYRKVQKAMENPHGMILSTGPTGSGKTTTLYAVLKILNKPDVHIATIEDPVEYDIEGVSQIQVNPRTNLTFAKGLRAIVRQDPDIIMVGEIRDEETAKIAVNSALTGHLVLSTLHTNDAATTLPRLLDMGIEPFLIASTVNIAIGQRLVRKLCEKCRVSYEITEEEKQWIKDDATLVQILQKKGFRNLGKFTLYKAMGCKVCNQTGFSGRTGIFEVLTLDEEIKALILQRASSGEIAKVATKRGMTTMVEDGLEKVLQGVTTLEEVLRVIRE